MYTWPTLLSSEAYDDIAAITSFVTAVSLQDSPVAQSAGTNFRWSKGMIHPRSSKLAMWIRFPVARLGDVAVEEP